MDQTLVKFSARKPTTTNTEAAKIVSVWKILAKVRLAYDNLMIGQRAKVAFNKTSPRTPARSDHGVPITLSRLTIPISSHLISIISVHCALIIEYDLNSAVQAALRIPELDNLQTCRGDQLVEPLLSHVTRGMSCHHLPIKPAQRNGTSGGQENAFVEDQLGVAWFHGRGGVAEDSDGEAVGPVVQDAVHKIRAGTRVLVSRVLFTAVGTVVLMLKIRYL